MDRRLYGAYQADSPEHLLDGFWERFARIFSFCCSETDQLRSTEGERRCHKDAAETLKPSVEGTRVDEVFPANITSLRTTTYIKNNTKNAKYNVSKISRAS